MLTIDHYQAWIEAQLEGMTWQRDQAVLAWCNQRGNAPWGDPWFVRYLTAIRTTEQPITKARALALLAQVRKEQEATP